MSRNISPSPRRARRGGHILLSLLLGAAALLVWWPLWFLVFGALTPSDELAATIGPALGAGEAGASARWQLLPSWPTLQSFATLLLDTPEFFAMFWNSCRQCSRNWRASFSSARRQHGRFPGCGSAGGGRCWGCMCC